METLGGKLKHLREKRNLLQKEVASELNISSQTYSRYENNLRNPDICMLANLALFYNVSTDYLLGIDKTYIDKNITLNNIDELEKQIIQFKKYINSCK